MRSSPFDALAPYGVAMHAGRGSGPLRAGIWVCLSVRLLPGTWRLNPHVTLSMEFADDGGLSYCRPMFLPIAQNVTGPCVRSWLLKDAGTICPCCFLRA